MFFEDDTSDLLARLNPEQLAAVTYPPQPVLVLAGAGSGKTRVLTTRIAWLIHTAQAAVPEILAVTFTNKAAKEMQTRLGALLPVNLRAMWLGTFHGLCHRFLRIHHRAAGLPQTFQILDGGDQLALIKRLLKELNISEERVPPRVLQGFINAQKESGLRAAALESTQAAEQRLIQCYAEYENVCRREGVADFAELLLRSYEVLNSDAALLAHYQQRFKHILVDEFQDTNRLQYAWLKLLAGGGAAVFAVGDDDQSIYRFRGANVGNMQDFLREFQAAAPIKLEQNYRSAANILAAANAVIAHNQERLGKNLRTEAGAGEPVRLFAAAADWDEARFVVEEAQSLHRDGTPWHEIAFLYRNNAQSRILEQTLFQAAVPYKIYGGLRFYERQEVKHALAYLRVAVNPADDNALLRIINFPPRGIGTRTVENLQAAARQAGVSLFQAACSGGAGKTAAFVQMVERWREQLGVLDLADILDNIIGDSGLYAHYQNQKQAAERERTQNLDELLNAAAAFRAADSLFENLDGLAEDDPLFTVLAFLSHASLESGENQSGNGSAVQLMTVHAAKGLEFDAVFVTGLEEGRFPSEQSFAERGGLEEERRLMYVAVTRARKRLYLSMAQQRMLHGQMQYGVWSRFADEIPDALVKHLSAPVRGRDLNRTDHLRFSNEAPTLSRQNLPQDYDGFRIGENVRHAKFGTGVIIAATDKGSSARLKINFGKQGIKELDTAFAKLEKI
ncbi:MAG: UvrD-helicase domain-containing protein [Conchiformibius sp.]|nr:UvrD-helicase domain-containing protein [Conchiformibius sp.]